MLANIREYHRPTKIQEALRLLNRKNIKTSVLAGGTYLTLSRSTTIEALVDINYLGLSGIRKTSRGLSIGATARIQDLVESPVIKKFAGGILHDAVKKYASIQIRNASTLGGNFLWPRPWSDVTPVLLALNATVILQDSKKKTKIPIENFLGSKSRSRLRGSLIVEIFIPSPPRNFRAHFLKFTQTDFDVSFLNAAIAMELDSQKNVVDVRLVLGAVRGQPFRLTTAESKLRGQKLSKKNIKHATHSARRVRTYDEPRASARYKQKMIPVILRRALEACL